MWFSTTFIQLETWRFKLNLVSILLQQNIKKKKGEFKVDSETSDAGDDQSKLREASKDIGMIKV